MVGKGKGSFRVLLRSLLLLSLLALLLSLVVTTTSPVTELGLLMALSMERLVVLLRVLLMQRVTSA